MYGLQFISRCHARIQNVHFVFIFLYIFALVCYYRCFRIYTKWDGCKFQHVSLLLYFVQACYVFASHVKVGLPSLKFDNQGNTLENPGFRSLKPLSIGRSAAHMSRCHRVARQRTKTWEFLNPDYNLNLAWPLPGRMATLRPKNSIQTSLYLVILIVHQMW